MLDPSLFSGVPFHNRTAFADAAGTLDLYHAVLADAIARLTQTPVRKYPLGNGRGEKEWLTALTRQHADEAQALGLPGPPDFTDFSLGDPSEWASFWFIVANDLQRIRIAAGVS